MQSMKSKLSTIMEIVGISITTQLKADGILFLLMYELFRVSLPGFHPGIRIDQVSLQIFFEIKRNDDFQDSIIPNIHCQQSMLAIAK